MSSPPQIKKTLYERFWESLGGWETLIKDVYFRISIGLAILLAPYWWHPNWWDTAISTLSVMIGFSVGGFSVVLALMNRRLGERLVKRSSYNAKSPFLMFNAAFALYMVSGFAALAYAFVCKAWYQPAWLNYLEPDLHDLGFFLTAISKVMWAVGGWIFSYSLCSGVSAIFYIYQMAEVLQKVADADQRKEAAAKAAAAGATAAAAATSSENAPKDVAQDSTPV